MLYQTDVCLTEKWMNNHKWYNDNTSAYDTLPMSILSTCTGGGNRVATANLVSGGRSNAVWVMVVLSDGVANLTDTPQTFPEHDGVGIPAVFNLAHCAGILGNNPLWSPKFCVKTVSTRYCINPTPLAAPTPVAPGENCPPGAVFETAPSRLLTPQKITLRKITPAIWWIGMHLLIRQCLILKRRWGVTWLSIRLD